MSGVLGTNYGEFAKQVKDPKKYDQNTMQAAADVGSGILSGINAAEEFVVPHAKRDPLNPMAYVKDVNEWFEPAAQMAIDESQGEAEYPGWAYGLAATPIIGKVAKPVAKAAKGLEGAAEPLLKAMEKLSKEAEKRAKNGVGGYEVAFLNNSGEWQTGVVNSREAAERVAKNAEQNGGKNITITDLNDTKLWNAQKTAEELQKADKPSGKKESWQETIDDIQKFKDHSERMNEMDRLFELGGDITPEQFKIYNELRKAEGMPERSMDSFMNEWKKVEWEEPATPQLLADVPAEETVMENFLDSRFPFRKENKSLLSNADVSKSELLKSAEKGFNELIYSGRLNGRQEENVYKALKEGDVNKIVELANRYGVEL